MNRAAFFYVIMASLLAGCGGAGTSPAPLHSSGPSGAAGTISASIGYVSAYDTGVQPTVQATPLVMYDGQFLDFMEDAYLLGLVAAPPVTQQAVSWNSSNSAAVTLSTQYPFGSSAPNYAVPTAPPGQIYAQVGPAYGKSTIVASTQAASASIVAYHYPSLSFGCRFRYRPAWAFDPDRTTSMQDSANWTSADLYDTFPAAQLQQLDPCLNSPLAAGGTTETWHMPYGGTVLPSVSLQAFTTVQASQWSNAGTTFSPSIPSLVLFKTKEGRIVKALLPIGPYEVSGLDGTFPF
jgi:hypothetical protein